MTKHGAPNTSAEYQLLPESIKSTLTEKEYCWLSEEEKGALVGQHTMPDYEED